MPDQTAPRSMEELHKIFLEDVYKIPEGENIKQCIQCGTCTAGCTVFELDKTYNPRRLIQTFLVGETPLDIQRAWLCSTCGVCTERCPKDVWPMNVMLSARGLMVRSRPQKGVPRDRLRSLTSACGRQRRIMGWRRS